MHWEGVSTNKPNSIEALYHQRIQSITILVKYRLIFRFNWANFDEFMTQIFRGCCQTQPQLANQPQLQLVWVGSRSWLCFPTEEEGRRKEAGRNPHLASSKKDWPYMSELWWLYCGCLEGAWKFSGGCLAVVWWVSGRCLEGVLRVSGRCLDGVWRISMGCLNGNLVSQDCWCQDRSSQDR